MSESGCGETLNVRSWLLGDGIEGDYGETGCQ
jgi:hypothetical protein